MNKTVFKDCYFGEACNSEIISDDEFETMILKSLSNGEAIVSQKHVNGMYNLLISVEEMGELIHEVSHFIRKKNDKYDVLNALSDVMLTIEYIKKVVGVSDEEVEKALNIKKHNLRMILEGGDYG